MGFIPHDRLNATGRSVGTNMKSSDFLNSMSLYVNWEIKERSESLSELKPYGIIFLKALRQNSVYQLNHLAMRGAIRT